MKTYQNNTTNSTSGNNSGTSSLFNQSTNSNSLTPSVKGDKNCCNSPNKHNQPASTNKVKQAFKKGFTLVEILIVVIILGILAAIVIPQFTNASESARTSSAVSQLQTMRSQIELYKVNHLDQFPLNSGVWDWTRLTGKTLTDGTPDASGPHGPYLQQVPTNPWTNSSSVEVGTSTAPTGSTTSSSAYFFHQPTGKIFLVSAAGTVDVSN